MKLEKLLDKLKTEIGYLVGLFIVGIVLFKIAFFKEDIFVIVRFLAGFYWLFVLPGFFMMYTWLQLRFTERFIIGTVIGLGMNGMLSYMLGIMGVHINSHIFIIPIVLFLFGFFLIKYIPSKNKE